jgi:hypothetical protein
MKGVFRELVHSDQNKNETTMKNLFTLSMTILFAVACFGQSACGDEAIMAAKGNWKKAPDALMRSGSVGQSSPARVGGPMDAIGNLFKTADPEPKGMEANWYKSMAGDPVIPEGPMPYQVNSFYLAWYCNRNLHKLMLGDETGTWAYAFVNGFSWFMSDQHDLLKVRVDGQKLYLLPTVKGMWKEHTLYQSSSHGEKSSCIILTHNNRLPWKPITQGQYLKAVRPSLDQRKQAVIDDYIRTHTATLQQAAVIENGYQDDFNGHFSSLENGGHLLVTVDTAYFDKRLPRYAAQFIVLYWRWDIKTPGLNFKRQFEDNFPVDALNTMIDK